MTDIKAQIKEFRIGEKIRGLRQLKRLTLQELSELTTLSKPLLSQIENQQVIPHLTQDRQGAQG
jgi:transcriptional regulator with XRE-family HTH domain